MRCYRKVKKSLKVQNKSWPDKRIDRVARAVCVSRTGQKFKHGESNASMMLTPFEVKLTEAGTVKDFVFSFQTVVETADIEEVSKKYPDVKLNDPDCAFVAGTAIYPTTSSNSMRYLEEELKKAAPTLKGCKCQIDHSFSAKDTFGKVIDSWWDDKVKETGYVSALQGNHEITEKVEKGYIDAVSVAGSAETVECSICGEEASFFHRHIPNEEYDGEVAELIPKNIVYKQLGFVAYPGVENASAFYIPSSITEAIENMAAVMEYSSLDGTAVSENRQGDYTLSAEPDEKLLKKMERMKLQLEEANSKASGLEKAVAANDGLQLQLEESRKMMKTLVVSEITKINSAMGRIKEEEVEAAEEELMGKDISVLKAKLEVLKEWQNDAAKRDEANASTRGLLSEQIRGATSLDLSEQKKGLTGVWLQELKKARISEWMFGKQPSVSAVRTVAEYDWENDRWIDPLGEIAKKPASGGVK